MNIKKIILENTPHKKEEQRINFKEMQKLDNKIFEEYEQIFGQIPNFEIAFRENSYWTIIEKEKCLVRLDKLHVLQENYIYELNFIFYEYLIAITGTDVDQNQAMSIELKSERGIQNNIFMIEKQKNEQQMEEMCQTFIKQKQLFMPKLPQIISKDMEEKFEKLTKQFYYKQQEQSKQR